MTIQDRLKLLEAEWRRIDEEHKLACAADELLVIAGRLDKNIYIEQDRKRAAKVALAKAALTSQARSLLAQDGGGE